MISPQTYGAGGSVSTGSDSYTWAQSVSDTVTLGQSICDTVTASPVYDVIEYDELIDDFYDVGTDILGANDSILGGCDTYTWGYDRDLAATVTDSGDSATPFYVSGYYWDDDNNGDTGSSTLTTNGHVYATDTFGYDEDTGDTATASQSYGNAYNGWIRTGAAGDNYGDYDGGTITTSDNVTTSEDSFILGDTHSISGYWYNIETGDDGTIAINDTGVNVDEMNAEGGESNNGSTYGFVDDDSSNDDFILTKNVPGSYSGVCTDYSEGTDTTSGTSSTGLAGDTYSYSVSDTYSEA